MDRKSKFVAGLLAACAFSSPAKAEENRLWTDRSQRFQVTGQFVGLDGDQVILRKSDGDLVQIERGQLTGWDEAFAQRRWEQQRLDRLNATFARTLAGYSPVYTLWKEDRGQLASFRGGFVVAHDKSPERWYYLDFMHGRLSVVDKAPTTTLQQLADAIGVATATAWEVRRMLPQASLQGRLVRVADDHVHIDLGKIHGLRPGLQFFVTRPQQEIIDPATGLSLGVQKAWLAQLVVRTVEDRFAIASYRLADPQGAALQPGDTATLDNLSAAVAVMPLTDTDLVVNFAKQPTPAPSLPQPPTAIEPVITVAGAAVGERLATELERVGVPLIDRTTVQRAIQQIRVPGEAQFDPSTIQEFGKLTGARYVLGGTTSEWRRALHPADQRGRLPYVESVRAHLRLIDVETGEVLSSINGRYYAEPFIWP